jgi:hypothetical protein
VLFNGFKPLRTWGVGLVVSIFASVLKLAIKKINRGRKLHKTSPMAEQAAHGYQIESGDLNGDYWCAIANTENGTIPGKSSNGKCWYPYGGQEIESTDFKIVDGPVIFTEDPNEVKPLGKQTDGAGTLYCVVVETEWGKIPGKAKRGTAWYSYGGEERSTSDTSKFKYVGPAIASLADTEQVENLVLVP